MAEKKAGGGWIKAMLGGMAGLLSGAAVMYLTPLVNSVVKPGTPLANFEARTDGLNVTFHNLSSGPQNVQGWWEFGDGSPLQPVVPDEEFVTHTYPRGGDYSVKLILKNSVGEANERSINLQIEAGAKSDTPAVVSLDAVSVTGEPFAPATFRLTSEVKNAQLCVWDTGEGLDVAGDPGNRKERFVTFQKAGGYRVKLAAVNGTQLDQKTVVVNVKEPPVNALTVTLSVADQAMRVEQNDRAYTFSLAFPPDYSGDVYKFTRSVQANRGFAINDVRLQSKAGSGVSMKGQTSLGLDASALGLAGARNVQLQRDADGKTARLIGELVRAGKGKEPPIVTLPVVLVEERRQATSRPAVPMTAVVAAPGTTQLSMPPMPKNWENPKRAMKMELRDGNQLLWQDTQMPRGAAVVIRGRRYLVTATTVGDQVKLTLVEAPAGGVSANR